MISTVRPAIFRDYLVDLDKNPTPLSKDKLLENIKTIYKLTPRYRPILFLLLFKKYCQVSDDVIYRLVMPNVINLNKLKSFEEEINPKFIVLFARIFNVSHTHFMPRLTTGKYTRLDSIYNIPKITDLYGYVSALPVYTNVNNLLKTATSIYNSTKHTFGSIDRIEKFNSIQITDQLQPYIDETKEKSSTIYWAKDVDESVFVNRRGSTISLIVPSSKINLNEKISKLNCIKRDAIICEFNTFDMSIQDLLKYVQCV